MKKLDAILYFIVDLIITIKLVPITCVLYTLFLLYICIRGEDNFKKKFTEFGNMVIKHFIGIFEFHKGRILGD